MTPLQATNFLYPGHDYWIIHPVLGEMIATYHGLQDRFGEKMHFFTRPGWKNPHFIETDRILGPAS